MENNNKLIAEFIGEKSDTNENVYYIDGFYSYLNDTFVVNEMKFHTSWDWLIPVVKKIKSININKPMDIIEQLNHRLLFVDKLGLYNSVIEFIKWYNKRKLK